MIRLHSMTMLLALTIFLPGCVTQAEGQAVDPSPGGAGVVDCGWVALSHERDGWDIYRFDITIDPEGFTLRPLGDFHHISAPMFPGDKGMNYMSYASGDGAPVVPRVHIRFALPPGVLASDVVVDHSESHLMEGEYDLMPSNPRKKCGDGSSKPILKDPDIYGSSGCYPGDLVQLGGVRVIHGVATADIFLIPVQYHPDLRKLEIFTKISMVMLCEAGVGDGMYLYPKWNEERVKIAERDARRWVMNPEGVVVCTREDALKASTAQDVR